jgi:hypothetical protein
VENVPAVKQFEHGKFYKIKARKMNFIRPGGSMAVMPNKKLQENGRTHTVLGMVVSESPSAVMLRVSEVFQCMIAKGDLIKCRLATPKEIAEGLPEYAADPSGL